MASTTRPGPVNRSGSAQSDVQDNNALLAPSRPSRDGRSYSSATTMGSRAQSFATTGPPPGSFSSDLQSTYSRTETPRPDLGIFSTLNGGEDDDETTTEQRQAEYKRQIEKETKLKAGSENLLEALSTKSAKHSKDQRVLVEKALAESNQKLAKLYLGLETEIQKAKLAPKEPPPRPAQRMSFLYDGDGRRSPSRPERTDEREEEEAETESPTFLLAEILQALENENMQPEYYVERANSLVDLFKRNPTLKFDLAWSIFGLRIQAMLLSDSREVAAAGYRLTRHAITDRKSLQTIRALQTDILVVLSLVKDSKASVEREQALKFVRAFLDVKDGVREISRGVLRVIVAIAEHHEDRMRNICIMTAAEILIRDPALLVSAGGMGALTDALGEGNYYASESIAAAFLYLMDVPQRRQWFTSGHDLQVSFACFTDYTTFTVIGHEERLKANAKVIGTMLKSWPGLIALSSNDCLAIRSLIAALYNPMPHVRNILIEVFFDVLRITPPSWTGSFLAGRRLTTYGRVTNLRGESTSAASDVEDPCTKWSLVDHYTALTLAVFLNAGLVPAILFAENDTEEQVLKRKISLLLGEVLRMAHDMLPSTWGAEIQVLPGLLRSAVRFGTDDRFIATGNIYQVDSVNRTLFRSGPMHTHKSGQVGGNEQKLVKAEKATPQVISQIDEAQFRTQMVDTQILNTVNWTKWNWPLIQIIIDGALLNPKRLDEAIRGTKFVHRILGFYRPFKFRFSEIRNTKPNQKYVRAGCALMRTLSQNQDGLKYLVESKFIRQLAECLSHFDPKSGLISENAMFTPERMNETLTSGYFAMLGELSKDQRGMFVLERWKIINMFYHIVELTDHDYLIKALLGNMDFSYDGHLRILVSKAMTGCSKDVRIFSTRLLRRCATKALQPVGAHGSGADTAQWAIECLVTQLYDPEVEVCEVAIKILEEACNQKHSLEYVVKCAPALDHLGEIGAPLLLRFLSTSVGYHYLDGLDYITREMDDWFLGRNDTYVATVEASLAKAFDNIAERPQQQSLHIFDDTPEYQDHGLVPPHFYRELTRTEEGCKLLEQKGHFEEFAATIQDFGLEDEDAETILKVKGCLWAVGNVGSMALGSPFLEKTEVVRWIVEIAEKSQVISLKGTAFFVLGLVSRSIHGQEMLIQYGWDGAVDELGDALGYCIPLDFRKLFSIKPWASQLPLAPPRRGVKPSEPHVAVTDDDPINAQILKLTTNLGNTVLAKKAASELHSIKAKKAPGFRQPHLFRKVMSVLESHHFHVGVCRFVLELFDRSVLKKIILEEEEESVGGTDRNDSESERRDREHAEETSSDEDDEELSDTG